MSKKKTKIVIASVLKPVDDVRNYEKIGCTLANQGEIDIVMLGTEANSTARKDISLMAWRTFNRLSFTRVYIQFAFIKRIFALRPSLVIVTTHELLFMAVLSKLLLGFKLVYDVQEDYYKNLTYQRFYPWYIRRPAAIIIRSIEWISRPFINHYLLAEEIYSKELKFTKGKSTVVDNKSLPITNSPSDEGFKIVFTGTITAYSNVLESVDIYSKIKNQFHKPSLVIIGYCPSKVYENCLIKLAKNDQSISLQLSSKPVSHRAIIDQISTAHLGIIGYDSNPINEYKIPTKQYEYTAAKLPYIVRENTYWSELGTSWGGAIPVDFDDPKPAKLAQLMDKIDRNLIQSEPAEWQNNESILIKFITSLLP
jgi:glycosyltransferase involved in cell wall biosynthesis